VCKYFCLSSDVIGIVTKLLCLTPTKHIKKGKLMWYFLALSEEFALSRKMGLPLRLLHAPFVESEEFLDQMKFVFCYLLF
jgi:hypothetical protein